METEKQLTRSFGTPNAPSISNPEPIVGHEVCKFNPGAAALRLAARPDATFLSEPNRETDCSLWKNDRQRCAFVTVPSRSPARPVAELDQPSKGGFRRRCRYGSMVMGV